MSYPGRDPKVVADYLGKTPQARAPPATVTADEPGVARYELKRKFFNKFAKSLPRARKGGPTQVDYELVRIITESTEEGVAMEVQVATDASAATQSFALG